MFGPRKRLPAAPLIKSAALASVEDVGARDEFDEKLDEAIKQMIAKQSLPAEPDPSPVAGVKRRPWGYDVPDADTWQEKIDARLGIQH
jgi:hypothetical protein